MKIPCHKNPLHMAYLVYQEPNWNLGCVGCGGEYGSHSLKGMRFACPPDIVIVIDEQPA